MAGKSQDAPTMRRHSKGRRALPGCHAPERLDQAVRAEPAAQGMTINDYMITVLTIELHLLEEAPCGLDTVSKLKCCP